MPATRAGPDSTAPTWAAARTASTSASGNARVRLVGDVKTRGDRQMAEGSVRTLPGGLGAWNQIRVAVQK